MVFQGWINDPNQVAVRVELERVEEEPEAEDEFGFVGGIGGLAGADGEDEEAGAATPG